MYSGYNELNSLTPDAFLDWEEFRTLFDKAGDEYSQAQYAKGLEIGASSLSCGPRLFGERGQGAVYICANGTWAADSLPSFGNDVASYTSSYEGIGYHRSTADLLRGFLDSGARIVVHRYGQAPVEIQSAKKEA